MLAQIMSYIGTGKQGFTKIKSYTVDDINSEQQFLYDVFYAYCDGSLPDYYRSEARITAAYKLYAFKEFYIINHTEWAGWVINDFEKNCNNVTRFTWTYVESNETSDIRMPQNAKTR